MIQDKLLLSSNDSCLCLYVWQFLNYYVSLGLILPPEKAFLSS